MFTLNINGNGKNTGTGTGAIKDFFYFLERLFVIDSLIDGN
jgi:hypothetical protein